MTIASDLAQWMQDRALGIDTHVPIPRAPPSRTQVNVRYEPVRYGALRLIARHLDISNEDVLYDVGCGRGRVLCFFARMGLKKVVGVEFDPDLALAARRSAEALRGEAAPISVIQGDAGAQDYDEASILFLYHPFHEPVMSNFLAKVRASLERRPRRLTIVYCNPVCRSSLIDAGFGYPWETFRAPYGGHHYEVAIWRLPAAKFARNLASPSAIASH